MMIPIKDFRLAPAKKAAEIIERNRVETDQSGLIPLVQNFPMMPSGSKLLEVSCWPVFERRRRWSRQALADPRPTALVPASRIPSEAECRHSGEPLRIHPLTG